MPVRVGLQYIEQWKDSMENAVRRYEAEPIITGQIVFYGPSYFTRWAEKYGHRPLREDVIGKSGNPCAINRGFGSSCSEHQLYYYPRMVRPLAPKVLVYSAFGNYNSFGYSVEEAWELAQRVVMYALTDFPDIHVYICGAQYHRGDTEESRARYEKIDALIKAFVKDTPNCYYLNPHEYKPLQRDEIFIEDGVHYNQLGYDAYAEFFKEVLKEELDRF